MEALAAMYGKVGRYQAEEDEADAREEDKDEGLDWWVKSLDRWWPARNLWPLIGCISLTTHCVNE